MRRTRAEIEADRESEWRAMAGGRSGHYICGHCDQPRFCRGKSLKRMSCKPCYILHGPPKTKKLAAS